MEARLLSLEESFKTFDEIQKTVQYNLAKLDVVVDCLDGAEKESALQKFSTLLMQLNAGWQKMKQIDINQFSEPNHVTESQFLQYSIIDDIKRPDYKSMPTPSATWEPDIQYENNHIGFAFVSHISKEIGGECFIVDVAQLPKVRKLIGSELQPMQRLPELHEMFIYLYQERFLLRAVRANGLPPYSLESFDALLVDIGCKITIKYRNYKGNAFMITKEAMEVPSFARKCQIYNIPYGLHTFDLLHVRFQYKVLFEYGGWIFINILDKCSNELHSDEANAVWDFYSHFRFDLSKLLPKRSLELNKPIAHDVNVAQEVIMNVDDERSCAVNEEIAQNVESSADENSYFANEEIAQKIESNVDEKDPTNQTIKKRVTFDLSEENEASVVTKADKKMQLEKALYKTIDKLTLKENEDDLTKTRLESTQEGASQLSEENKHAYPTGNLVADAIKSIRATELPGIGETISVEVTFILNPCEFYAVNLAQVDRIKRLSAQIDSTDFQQRLQQCDEIPKVGDQVLGMYNAGHYRAVVSRVYDQNKCQVFYYDYGNSAKVAINEIFTCDTMLEEYPRFAIHFRMNRVSPCCENDGYSIQNVSKVLFAAPLQATVVDIINDETIGEMVLVVELIDENNVNVATMLATKDLVAYND